MKHSKLFSINTKDFLKGLFLVVLTAVITFIYQTVEAGSLTFDWTMIGKTALIAGLSYILKQLTTNSEGAILKPEK